MIADVIQDTEPIKEQPKPNEKEAIIRGVQDSYAGSGEPLDSIATLANAQDKAEELKDKILESLKLMTSPSIKATEALEKPPAAKPLRNRWISDDYPKPRVNTSLI